MNNFPHREPISLSTAFSSAGAATVVSALWPVDDELTRQLFGDFYAALARGSSPQAALREAQRRTAAAHPASHDWPPS